MAPFLPVQGISRSQNVRIGGQSIKFGKISYIDLCQLNKPGTITGAVEEAQGVSGSYIAKNTNYYYAITSVDAYGGETPASPELNKKTNNTSATENNVKLTWTKVPNATSYNVYRGTSSGAEKLLTNVTSAEYNDFGNYAEGTQTPPGTNNTFYNSNKAGYSPKAEIKNHSAIGAIEILGLPTATNLDWVPISAEATPWALTLESEKVKVGKAKELKQRSTGLFQETECAEASVSSIVSEANKEKYVAIVYNSLLNKVEGVVGANEAEGVEFKVAIEALNVKISAFQQVLYLLNTKGTTKTVTNVTSSLVPSLLNSGETYPVIARS